MKSVNGGLSAVIRSNFFQGFLINIRCFLFMDQPDLFRVENRFRAVLEETAGYACGFDGVENVGGFLVILFIHVADVNGMDAFGKVLYYSFINVGIVL
jgi:hypothetical protein